MFETVLIANRAEIALRIIKTLRRLGIVAVAVYAADDRSAPHVRAADVAMPVSSYLDIDAIVEACRLSGAQALHPGYGFLSENPALATACEATGVAFVGPPAHAGELMGDKLRAKQVAAAAGVPTVTGYTEAQARAADRSHYPLLVKAAAGGGGRGMRVVNRPTELDEALAAARRESLAGFGDDRVFIERFLHHARHIEVQVIADSHGTVLHLGERECSLQRRHQKLVEESPSPAVSAQLRATLGSEAVALCRAAGYVNAGTVEFIAAADDPAEHYFLECNARLQVEHPVTELVTGLDLVELQLRVAAGEPLELRQEQIVLRGHAIEARINAEDPGRGFLPASGRVLALDRPEGDGLRIDDALAPGLTVDTAYDSLLAKLIAHGETREVALGRLRGGLSRLSILGIPTTTAYLRGLLADEAVVAGRLDTQLVTRRGAPDGPIDDRGVAIAAAMLMLAEEASAHAGGDPFARVDGWRLGGDRAGSHWRLAVNGGAALDVQVPPAYAQLVTAFGKGRFAIDGRGEWRLARDGDVVWIGHGGWSWAVREAAATADAETTGDGEVRAPMPGQVLSVHGAVGDVIAAGTSLIVLESMKMELVLTAPIDGRIATLNVAPGERVALDQPLARLQAHE